MTKVKLFSEQNGPYELTWAVTICIRSVQDQVRQNTIMEWGVSGSTTP